MGSEMVMRKRPFRLGVLMLATLAGGSSVAAPPLPAAGVAVAFVSIRSGDPQIYTQDDSGQVVMLTSGKDLPSQPNWSARNQMAYTARVNGQPRLFVTDAGPGSAKRLTQDDVMETSASWSPDGLQLAYYAKQPGVGVELRVRELASGKTQTLAADKFEMGPAPAAWSADGRRLTFSTLNANDRSQVWVVGRDGSGLKNISEPVSPRGGVSPSLSPDGQKLVWVANQRGRSPVMLTDLATGASVDVTPGELSANETPRFSPDGRFITFASIRDNLEQARNDIFVMDLESRQVRNISQHPGEDFDPKWSPDGQRIVFASLRSGTSLLYEVNLINGQTRPLSTHASHDMDHVLRPMAALK
jgi:TolB protein